MISCNSSNLNNIDKSSPTNYNLVLPKIPTESSIGVNNPFIMNVHTAILPSVSLATEELRWQGNKTRCYRIYNNKFYWKCHRFW